MCFDLVSELFQILSKTQRLCGTREDNVLFFSKNRVGRVTYGKGLWFSSQRGSPCWRTRGRRRRWRCTDTRSHRRGHTRTSQRCTWNKPTPPIQATVALRTHTYKHTWSMRYQPPGYTELYLSEQFWQVKI